MSIFGKNKFAAVLALAAISGALSVEALDAANADLTAAGIKGAQLVSNEDIATAQDLQNQLDAANTAKETAEAALATAKADLTTAQNTLKTTETKLADTTAEFAKWKKGPAAESTETNREKDDLGDEPTNSIVDPNALHNVTINSFFKD